LAFSPEYSQSLLFYTSKAAELRKAMQNTYNPHKEPANVWRQNNVCFHYKKKTKNIKPVQRRLGQRRLVQAF